MPQLERFERVQQVVAGLVEQHVADPAAEHHSERRPYQEIIDILALDALRWTIRESEAIAPADQEPDDIGERIPANRKRPDRDRHRIDRGKRDREERHRRCWSAWLGSPAGRAPPPSLY